MGKCTLWVLRNSSVPGKLGVLSMVASTNTWEIESHSVGNGAIPTLVPPGHEGCVDSPPVRPTTTRNRGFRPNRRRFSADVVGGVTGTVPHVLTGRGGGKDSHRWCR